jgi:hypothetical protein
MMCAAAATTACRPVTAGRRRPVFTRGALPCAALLLLALLPAGCITRSSEAPVDKDRPPLTEVLARHTPGLMAFPGVVGTAEARTDDGHPCVLVLVERLTPELRRALPRALEGWPVRIEETGSVHAMEDSTR